MSEYALAWEDAKRDSEEEITRLRNKNKQLRDAVEGLLMWATRVHAAADAGLNDSEPDEFGKARAALSAHLEGACFRGVPDDISE
jgi:hypothetical protein